MTKHPGAAEDNEHIYKSSKTRAFDWFRIHSDRCLVVSLSYLARCITAMNGMADSPRSDRFGRWQKKRWMEKPFTIVYLSIRLRGSPDIACSGAYRP